ncbi:cobalt-precorrin-6A reductase [Luteipulveratus halotolerans]|uniref:Cobalt-precorrin-6X reductase n=1 Tax=Luteipulveratus halotolerans TaxID=1631356 RepID=A0A0L6CET3_9MICO|nr:cobalt-precorrin-6A reductase [Luteipulveratus halotolerans]KNX36386.1 cobalt-precorrin-6X reductase [Luteipulveratus halotolerans]
MTVLILGGTGEARELARLLVADGHDVVSSLAGAVREPRLPEGITRVGGFGGVDGLTRYLLTQRISAVVDATHPFAARISANAVTACRQLDVPLLRLARPGWSEHPAAATWHWVDDHVMAAATAADLGRRVLLTTGRQHLADLIPRLRQHQVIARVVDDPAMALPPTWKILRSRGPYYLENERDLLRRNAIDVLVTKDSGGAYTAPKLDAAADLSVPVVVVRRPQWPGQEVTAQVDTATGARDWALSAAARD